MEWTSGRLGGLPIDIIDGDRSSRYPKRHQLQGQGILFLNTTNIVDNKLHLAEANFISEEVFDRLSKGKLQHNDIIMTTRGSIGKVALFKNPRYSTGFINAQMLILRSNPNFIDPVFLYYLMTGKSFQETLANYASGSAQPQIPKTDLSDIRISFPPLPIQRKIAGILSAYDDLIENNTRRIKILEEMAQRIYREWFVNFRYPGHEKDKFVDFGTELGMIPEGWEVRALRNTFDVKYGKGLPIKDLLASGRYPVYGAGGIIGYYNELVSEQKVALITCRGNGSGTVWRTRGPAFITNNSFLIIPKEEFAHLEYHFIEQLCLNTNVKSALSGSAQPQITISGLAGVRCIIPKSVVVRCYCDSFGDMAELIDALYEQNSNLRRTRDLLLPKLISGEMDVSEMDIKTGGSKP